MAGDVGLEHGAGLLAISDVEAQHPCRTPGQPNLRRGGFGRRDIAHAVHDDVVAVSCQAQGDGLPDAAARAGDEDGTHLPPSFSSATRCGD